MNLRELLSLPAADAVAAGFARTLVELAGSADAAVLMSLQHAARAVSRATADGHTCIALAELPGGEDPTTLRGRLLASGLVATADGGAAALPLVLDADDRLYLNRYFATERRVADALRGFAALPRDSAAQALIARRLDERYGVDRGKRQRLAVERALGERLAIISGGPGTGKTTTVVQILALLLELDPACRIVLAAPTGKAAARLREAVSAGAAALPETLRTALPDESFTVHRLLATAYADGGRLACDVLVVDEASMLDLVLADRLLAAIGPATRLILLGDRQQLAAVEAGAVFAEISAADAAANPLLHTRCVELQESYRFAAATPLGRLAAAVRAGDAGAALAALADDDARLAAGDGAELTPATLAALLDGYAPYIEALRRDAAVPAALFAAFARFRVLCALRAGPRGVATLNALLDERLRAALAGAARPAAAAPWYPGRPVLVTRNDPMLRLFNGDIGITLAARGGGCAVCFEDSGAAGGFRLINPARLPPHETALAMTVHKAQGSEFDRVALILPATALPVATRELVYTGITRARQGVTLYAPSAVLLQAVANPTQRRSGLGARLRGDAVQSSPATDAGAAGRAPAIE